MQVAFAYTVAQRYAGYLVHARTSELQQAVRELAAVRAGTVAPRLSSIDVDELAIVVEVHSVRYAGSAYRHVGSVGHSTLCGASFWNVANSSSFEPVDTIDCPKCLELWPVLVPAPVESSPAPRVKAEDDVIAAARALARTSDDPGYLLDLRDALAALDEAIGAELETVAPAPDTVPYRPHASLRAAVEAPEATNERGQVVTSSDLDELYTNTQPVPGCPGYRQDERGRRWYSSSWLRVNA